MHAATAQIKTPDWPRIQATAARAILAYDYLEDLYPDYAPYCQERIRYWQRIREYAATTHSTSTQETIS